MKTTTGSTGRGLDLYSRRELLAIYSSIMRRVGYGWDWPTLRLTYPHIAKVLRAVYDELHGLRSPMSEDVCLWLPKGRVPA